MARVLPGLGAALGTSLQLAVWVCRGWRKFAEGHHMGKKCLLAFLLSWKDAAAVVWAFLGGILSRGKSSGKIPAEGAEVPKV